MLDQTYDSSFQVQKIVDEKQIAGQPHYLVKWKGYGSDQNTWEPTRHLDNAQEKLKEWELYKRKEINYLEYHKLADKIQLNQPSKKRFQEAYHPARSKQRTSLRRQTAKPYQIMPTSANYNSNQKTSIFEKAQSKRILKNQKNQRKKKELAIFQQRLKSKPKVWQQYLTPQNKISQSCQQIKNVVSQALMYHKKHFGNHFDKSIQQSKGVSKSDQKKKIQFSSLEQKQSALQTKQNRRNKLNKLQKVSIQKQQKTNTNKDIISQKQKYLIVPTKNELKTNIEQNKTKQIQILKSELRQESSKRIQMTFKRLNIHPSIIKTDTIRLTQIYLKKQKKFLQKTQENNQEGKKLEKQLVDTKIVTQIPDKSIVEKQNFSKQLQTMSQSFKNTLEVKDNFPVSDIQNKQINEVKDINFATLSLSSIKYISEELSHSLETLSDLELAAFIYSHQDCYYPIQKINCPIEKLSKSKVDQKQNFDQNFYDKLYQTKSSLLGNENQSIPTKVVKILASQGQKYAEIEFESKLRSHKMVKIVEYQQIRKNYPELLVNYFQGYMVLN